jgi:hypothetical protein
MKTELNYATDIAGLKLQLGQAWLALALIEDEVLHDMRQSELLAMLGVQRGNINSAADPALF